MKRNDQGLSLVELLVALAIMGVLGSMLALSMSVVPRTNAKACANGLKTIIGQTRLQTMGKKETVLKLIHSGTDGNFYTEISVDNGSGLVPMQKEFCGKSTVEVYYHMETPASGDPAADANDTGRPGYNKLTTTAGSDEWMISFDRSTGKELEGGPVSAPGICDALLVEGGGTAYLIRIYSATGKVTMEQL